MKGKMSRQTAEVARVFLGKNGLNWPFLPPLKACGFWEVSPQRVGGRGEGTRTPKNGPKWPRTPAVERVVPNALRGTGGPNQRLGDKPLHREHVAAEGTTRPILPALTAGAAFRTVTGHGFFRDCAAADSSGPRYEAAGPGGAGEGGAGRYRTRGAEDRGGKGGDRGGADRAEGPRSEEKDARNRNRIGRTEDWPVQDPAALDQEKRRVPGHGPPDRDDAGPDRRTRGPRTRTDVRDRRGEEAVCRRGGRAEDEYFGAR